MLMGTSTELDSLDIIRNSRYFLTIKRIYFPNSLIFNRSNPSKIESHGVRAIHTCNLKGNGVSRNSFRDCRNQFSSVKLLQKLD